MSDINEVLPGTTLTPTHTVTPKVISGEIDTNNFILSGSDVSGITHDHTVDDRNKLPSSYALKRALAEALRDVEDLQGDFDTIYFSPVLSDPIIDPFFVDINWGIDGFVHDSEYRLYINKKTPQLDQASLIVKNSAIKNPGTHFIHISIVQLDGGSITVSDETGTVLKEFIAAGNFSMEVDITQPSIAYLKFSVNNLQIDQYCKIQYIYVHYVKTAFGRYMDYMSAKILSGGSGFATPLYVDTQDALNLQAARQYTNDVVNMISGDIQTHLSAINNPHGVTFSQVGAAAAIHTHTPIEVGSAPAIHTHTPAEVGSAPVSHTHTPVECGASPVNHLHTPISLGAADRVHTHTPIECGSAPENHNHTLSQISNISDITTQISNLETLVNTLDNNAVIDGHIQDTDNPHGTNKEQVGLGEVENAPMATNQEAIEGVLPNRYMNPINTKVAMATVLNTPASDVSKLVPTPIRTIEWSSTVEDVVVPIFKNRIYHISVKCQNITSLKNLGIAVDTKAMGNIIRNNICMARTMTIGGEPVNLVGWDMSIDNHFKLMLPTLGINKASGELIFNTTSMTLTGTMCGHVLDPNTGIDLLDKSYPYTISSTYKDSDIPVDVEYLIFYALDPMIELDMVIVIYELVQPTQEPVMVIDATPVGMIVTRYSNTPVIGWGLIDGSELSRANNPELFNFAVENNTIIYETDWQNEVATNGYTRKFSYGDEVTTFRLPKDPVSTTGEYRYIKLKYTQVPSGDEILYRYVWEN